MSRYIEQTREFAMEQIALNARPNRYHFRNRQQHTERVVTWAKRIQEVEGGDLEVVIMSALLHDIGWDHVVNHALVSGKMAKYFLDTIKYPAAKAQRVLQAVNYHNSRSMEIDLFIESKIIRDADMLDEVGATTVIWDAMSSAYKDDASYEMVYHKCIHFYNHLRNNSRFLVTQSGKAFFDQRLDVYKTIISELSYELDI